MTVNEVFFATIAPVRDADFRRYQRLVLAEAGIQLSDAKRALLTGRLARRLRQLGLSSFGNYFEHVCADAAERVRMLDLLLTNETSFFREPLQFKFLTERVVPEWKAQAANGQRSRSLRIWSAGCATGEEAYSVAMTLRDALPDWKLEILATDLSQTALQTAENALWPIGRAAQIPDNLLHRYMLRGIGAREGWMKAGNEIRETVHFRRVNLHDAAQSPRGPFDLVLCRNVLIYFEAESRRRAIERLIAACVPGGYFFVGHAETLHGFRDIHPVQPTIWRVDS